MPNEGEKINNSEGGSRAPLDREAQLLVEGKDDEHFFSALIEYLGIENIQVHDIEGSGKLKSFIRNLSERPSFNIVKSVGIILDADNRPPDSVLQSVRSALEGVPGLSAPERAGEFFGDEIKTGVFILPDNQNPGMLETLIWDTIDDEKMRECIDQFLECAESAPSGDLDRLDKSRIHAYIATQKKPNVSLSVATHRGYWNFEHPALAGIKDFLVQLSQAASGG